MTLHNNSLCFSLCLSLSLALDRARDTKSDEIVALKKVRMDKEKDGKSCLMAAKIISTEL